MNTDITLTTHAYERSNELADGQLLFFYNSHFHVNSVTIMSYFRISNIWTSINEISILPLARMFEKRQKNIN
jgi:hypothetical protein